MIGKSKALLKQNNQREKELTKENNQVLTDMVVYLRGSDLSDYNQELVRADLIEMVLDAQVRGDDIEKVFGENYQSICDEIIRAFPKRTTSQKVLSGIGNVLTCISVLTWILALQGCSDSRSKLFHAPCIRYRWQEKGKNKETRSWRVLVIMAGMCPVYWSIMGNQFVF